MNTFYTPQTVQNTESTVATSIQTAPSETQEKVNEFKDAYRSLIFNAGPQENKIQLSRQLLGLINSLPSYSQGPNSDWQRVLTPLLNQANANHSLNLTLRSLLSASPTEVAEMAREIKSFLRFSHPSNSFVSWANAQPNPQFAARIHKNAESFALYACGLNSACTPRDALEMMAINLQDLLNQQDMLLEPNETIDLKNQYDLILDSINHHREIATTDLYNFLIQQADRPDGTVEVNRIPALISTIHKLTDSLSGFAPGRELYWLPLPATPSSKQGTEQYRYIEIVREHNPHEPLQPRVTLKVYDAQGYGIEPKLPPPYDQQPTKVGERGKKLTCAQFDITAVIKALKGNGDPRHANNLISTEHLAIKFFEYSRQLQFIHTTHHQMAVKPCPSFYSDSKVLPLESFAADLGLLQGAIETPDAIQPVRRAQTQDDSAIDCLLACIKGDLKLTSSYRKLKSHLFKSTLNLLSHASPDVLRGHWVDDAHRNGLNSVLKAHPLTAPLFQPLQTRWEQTIRGISAESSSNSASLPLTLNLLLQQINHELASGLSTLPTQTVETIRQQAINQLQDRIAKNEWRIQTNYPTAKLLPSNHHSLFNGNQRSATGEFTPVHTGFTRHLLKQSSANVGARLNQAQPIPATLEGGACSAMTLSFIKLFYEMKTELAGKVPSERLIFDALTQTYQRSINGFSFSSSYMTSLQAAFNTIEISQIPGLDTKRAKIDLLSNAVGLQVEGEASDEMDLTTPIGKAKLAHTIGTLKPGCYLIRALLEESNHKGERHGHSVAAFKDEHDGQLYYYDPNYGLRLLDHHNLHLNIKGIHKDFLTNKVRFYPVKPQDTNNAQESNPSAQLAQQINPILDKLNRGRAPLKPSLVELKTLASLIKESKFRSQLSTVLAAQIGTNPQRTPQTVGKKIPTRNWEKRLDTATNRLLKQFEPQWPQIALISSPLNKLEVLIALQEANPREKSQLISRLNQLDLVFKTNSQKFQGQWPYSCVDVPIELVKTRSQENWARLLEIITTLGENIPLTHTIKDRHAHAGELILALQEVNKALEYFPFSAKNQSREDDESHSDLEQQIAQFQEWIAIQTF